MEIWNYTINNNSLSLPFNIHEHLDGVRDDRRHRLFMIVSPEENNGPKTSKLLEDAALVCLFMTDPGAARTEIDRKYRPHIHEFINGLPSMSKATAMHDEKCRLVNDETKLMKPDPAIPHKTKADFNLTNRISSKTISIKKTDSKADAEQMHMPSTSLEHRARLCEADRRNRKEKVKTTSKQLKIASEDFTSNQRVYDRKPKRFRAITKPFTIWDSIKNEREANIFTFIRGLPCIAKIDKRNKANKTGERTAEDMRGHQDEERNTRTVSANTIGKRRHDEEDFTEHDDEVNK